MPLIKIPDIGELDIKAKCASCNFLIPSNEGNAIKPDGVEEKILLRLATIICIDCQPKI